MGLDTSLLEVVGVGLIICEEVRVVRESISFQAKCCYGLQGSGRSAKEVKDE